MEIMNDDLHTLRGMDGSEIVIRPIAETDSIAALTDLLHRAYRRLADMGLRFVATYQDEAKTRERLDEGRCWVAVDGATIIGTILYYSPAACSGTPWYDRDDVAGFGQFAVEPTLQRSGLGAAMLGLVERRARLDGARELALDTAEPATHLIEYYSKRGYRFIEYTQWDITNYRSVILSKNLVEFSPSNALPNMTRTGRQHDSGLHT